MLPITNLFPTARLSTTDRSTPVRYVDPALLPRVTIGAVPVASLSYTLADPDLWGHVRFGLDILQHRALTSVNPYSFTSDRAWVHHEWLSETAMGAAYATGGVWGLSVLKLGLIEDVEIRARLATRGDA
jgi:hypothetical protein